MHIFKKSMSFAAVALVAMVGCSKNSGSEPAPGASQGSEATPPESPQNTRATAMTDGQILQVLANVDSGEIEQAQVALTKAQSPAVREFAQHMVDQHTKSQQDAKQLEVRTKIIPSPSDPASDVHKKGSKALDELKSTDASSFDATYMKAQIQQHQDVLNMLNEKLMPAATSSELRETLEKTRSMVQHHIDMAKQIQV